MKSESGRIADDGMTIQELVQSTKKMGRKIEGAPVVYLTKSELKPKSELVRFTTETPSSGDETYHQIVEFYWVDVSKTKDRGHGVLVKTASGRTGYIKKLDQRNFPVAVRCSCKDYQFTWARANKLEGAFTCPRFPVIKTKGKRAPRNPQQTPGVCKHLLGVFKKLRTEGFIR